MAHLRTEPMPPKLAATALLYNTLFTGLILTIVTRKGAGTDNLSGLLTLQLTGLRDGKRTRLAHDALTGGNREGLAFRMKHFARLEGALVVPDGFEPSRVRLSVSVSGDNAGRIQRVFSWQQAIR